MPTPIEMSAPPWVCANNAPARPTSAFDTAMPASTAMPVLTPCARAMRAFEPVARIASPVWVAKKPSSNNFTASTTNTSKSGRKT